MIRYKNKGDELSDKQKSIIGKPWKNQKLEVGIWKPKEQAFLCRSFYETDYKKAPSGGCMGPRVHSISDVLNIIDKKKAPSAKELAERLNGLERINSTKG